MQDVGIEEKNIYSDRQSGRDFERPGYQKLIGLLDKNDVLVIKSIDRLGRNYTEILEQWRLITKEKGADSVVLDMPLLDTRTSRDLTGSLISDIVLQLLSYVAETERAFIHQRQAEGIAAAKARGVHMGRRAEPLPNEFYPLYEKLEKQEISLGEMAERMGISMHQLSRMRKKPQNRMR